MPEIEGRVMFTNLEMTDFLHFAAGHHFAVKFDCLLGCDSFTFHSVDIYRNCIPQYSCKLNQTVQSREYHLLGPTLGIICTREFFSFNSIVFWVAFIV